MRKHKDENSHHWPECFEVFNREDALKEHLHQKHGWRSFKQPSDNQEAGGTLKKLEIDRVNVYNIEKTGERRIEKFKTTASYYTVRIKDQEIQGLSTILKTLTTILQSILEHITEMIPTTELVRLSIDNPELD
ncbi:hypothetical protein MAR_006377 [Mya arenaria]|uniref:C2H2-type domain-containing protein n=1 Tax=Mya arenaria TaxID=6604 RepID=A0ABY7DBC8_MYAAR|nr:hypothetical protein MAR_006377 [Mya arenaria]